MQRRLSSKLLGPQAMKRLAPAIAELVHVSLASMKKDDSSVQQHLRLWVNLSSPSIIVLKRNFGSRQLVGEGDHGTGLWLRCHGSRRSIRSARQYGAAQLLQSCRARLGRQRSTVWYAIFCWLHNDIVSLTIPLKCNIFRRGYQAWVF